MVYGPAVQVTLIDQGERFIFKPLLYELINGTAQAWEVAPTFAQLLAPYPIQFVQVRQQACRGGCYDFCTAVGWLGGAITCWSQRMHSV
jgi:hypothetical protein